MVRGASTAFHNINHYILFYFILFYFDRYSYGHLAAVNVMQHDFGEGPRHEHIYKHRYASIYAATELQQSCNRAVNVMQHDFGEGQRHRYAYICCVYIYMWNWRD